jgi:uncharacterized coiled-coil protein SlyX
MATDTLPPDLTLLSGSITEMGRDVRLLRLQVDNIAARLAAQDQRHDQRFSAIDQRLATLEQSIHELIGETARGFGQQQQQLTRVEQRLDALGTGLAGIQETLAAQTKLLGG